MAEYLIQDTTLNGIANAIREKEGSSASIPASEFAARIGAIKTGTDPSAWVLTLADGSTVTGIVNVLRMTAFANEVMKITDADGIVQWESVLPSVNTALEFASASAFTMSVSTPGWNGTMEYHNGDDWVIWDGSEISSGGTDGRQRIYIRGTGNTKVSGTNTYRWTLTGTEIECNGNIENLLDYATVAAGEHPVMAENCYNRLFMSCTSLTTAPSLPATTLAKDCYGYMFSGCTSLTTAPSLPATTLAENCYQYMFSGCTSLTTAPSLSATTLAKRCCRFMFNGCTSLTTAPSLPATTLAENCYTSMFENCTSLTTVPSLPATTLAEGCYEFMFGFCEKIKVSSTETDTYTTPYRIPMNGTGTESASLICMFEGTGGTFTGTPSINTTYYLDSSNTIV